LSAPLKDAHMYRQCRCVTFELLLNKVRLGCHAASATRRMTENVHVAGSYIYQALCDVRRMT
jgi:hypothetical protein